MRIHFVLGAITLLLIAVIVGNRPQPAMAWETVTALAKTLASAPYAEPETRIPDWLLRYNYDQHRDIRWNESRTLWRKEGFPFQIKFFHPGYIFNRTVDLYEVLDQSVERIRFSPTFFDYGKNALTQPVPEEMGYAGFRIHYPLNREDYLDELCVFLGASYFRGLAKDQQYGLSARGLAINTGIPKQTEEFPRFIKFWLHRPGLYDRSIELDALLDSPSVSGAYHFTIYPGEETRMHIKARLFFRKAVKRIGIAPMSSMYWYGENTSNTFGNFRPEVHDSDGLLVKNSNRSWIWRPLSWSPTVQSNTFSDKAGSGFGLLQRDRDFTHYQDLEAHYHRRPSLWVEPLKGFGSGKTHLLQLPTDNEYMDNIVSYWEPDAQPEPGKMWEIEYNLYWYTEQPQRPPLATCLGTRIDSQETRRLRHIYLDFKGGPLDRFPAEQAILADVTAVQKKNAATVKDVLVQHNPFRKSWRVSFVVSTTTVGTPIELECRLTDAAGAVLSETWTYTWNP